MKKLIWGCCLALLLIMCCSVACAGCDGDGDHRRMCHESVCFLCGDPYTGDIIYHTFYEGIYDSNKDVHWLTCDYCGAAADWQEEHSRYCGESRCMDCDAFYSGDQVTHEVDWAEFATDGTTHWHGCPCLMFMYDYGEHVRYCYENVCYTCGVGYNGENVEHNFNYESLSFDETGHWYECKDCGGKDYIREHERYCDQSFCSACNAVYTGEENVWHNIDMSQYVNDGEYHWRVCLDCYEKFDEEDHWRNCNESVCYICDNAYTGDNYMHDQNYYDMMYDDVGHWYGCNRCGVQEGYGEHYRTCDTSVCTICDAAYTGTNVYHRFIWEYESNEDQHWYSCERCDEKTSLGDHKRKCNESVCETCGLEYTGDNWEHDYRSIETKYDDTYHWGECSDCGEKTYEDFHCWECTEPDKCFSCGATGVTFEGTVHFNVFSTFDEQAHWRECPGCGEVFDKEEHYSECQNLGYCLGCNNTYEDNGHVVHLNMEKEVSYDETYHWYNCIDCGENVDKEAHLSSCVKPDTCTDCGATGDFKSIHEWGDLKYDANEHWNVCALCDEKLFSSSHYAFCDELTVCYGCGAENIASAEIGHRYPEDPANHNDVTHELLCESCGEHFFGSYVREIEKEATCTEDGVGIAHCWFCAEDYETVIKGGHVWAGEANAEGNIVCQNCNTIRGKALNIIKQPEDVKVASGKKAKVTVEAVGEELTYQWYVKSVGSDTFAKSSIAGPSYSVTMTAARDGNQVYCVVMDPFGNIKRTDTATLTMAPELKITQQPASVEVASGKTAKVTVEAEGDGLTYQWYVKAKGASKFTKSSISGATYSVKMTSSRSGNQVYCVVKDQYGSSVKTNTVTLTMKASSLKITKQPASVEVASGQTAKVSVTAEGEGLSYKWYVKAKGASKFTKSSLTGSSYSVKMTAARNGNQVYCVVTDKSGATVQSNTVTLTMKASSLKITQQPVSVEVASGKTAKVSVTAEGEGVSYKWYVKAAGTSTFKKSSLTGSSYSVTMTSARNGNQVYCIVTDKSGNTVQSNTVTITMAAKLVITKQPVSVSVASGAKASVTVAAQGEGLTYQWYVKAKGTSTFKKSSTSSATYSVTMTSARDGNQVYCIVTDRNGNTVKSNTVTLNKK